MNYLRLLVVCLTGLFCTLSLPRVSAQGCNDVSILYTEPDCYRPRPGTLPGGTAGNSRTCQPASACEDEKYNYTAAGGPWTTVAWTVLSGPSSPALSPSASSANISVIWPTPGTYVLSLTVTDANGNTFTKCLEISVKEKPVANFTFNPNGACSGSVVNFTNTTTFGGTAMYSWNFGDPGSGAANTSASPDPSHVFSTDGTFWVTLVAYSSITTMVGVPNHGDVPSIVTCCADTVRKQVTVAKGNVKIECISTVCPGKTVTYTVPGCGSAVWGAPVGGTLVSSTSTSITVQWGSGTPQGQLSVTCNGCTSYATVPIVPASPAIAGPLNPCTTGSGMYTSPYLPGTGYQWTLTNLTTNTVENALLSTYPEANTAWVDWGSATGASYELSLTLLNKHLCCGGTSKITITPRPTFRINNAPSICAGQSAGFFPNVASTYNWTIAPTAGVSPLPSPGPGYNPTLTVAGTYTVTATNTGTNTCNTTASTTLIVVPVPVPDTIVGPLRVCSGNPYTYTMANPAPAGYFYQWTASAGIFMPGGNPTTAGNTAIAQFGALPQTIVVSLQKSGALFCSVGADTIVVNSATPGTVMGNDSVCVDGSANYFISGGTLPAGTTITWSVTPASLGTITSGQGTNSVTILWHGTAGPGPWTASVNASSGCGNAAPKTGVVINPKFVMSITQSGLDICQPGGLTLTANGAPSGASYTWSPQPGSGPSLSGVDTARGYSVTATKGGCSASAQTVVENPFVIQPSSCGVPICTSSGIRELLGVFVEKPASGTFTYEWRYGTCAAPGAIIKTTTMTALNDTFNAPGAGNYCVIVRYGNCERCVGFLVKNICCPDVNVPAITSNVQLTCDSFRFSATTPNPTGASITWDFGDGTTMAGASGVAVTHKYQNAGIYCVTFCVGPPTPNTAGCTDNCAATTAVVPIQPRFRRKLACTGCLSVENTSLIYGNSSYVSYSWNWGDMTTPSTGANPLPHCYSAGGTYVVTLSMTYSNAPISCTKTFRDTIVFVPLSISNTSPVCAGVPAGFSSNPGGFQSYNWNFGDGINGFTSPIQHAYASSGTYNVTLTVLDQLGIFCTKTDTLVVSPAAGPCVILPGYICPGSNALLTAPGGAASYQWQVETSPGVFANAPGASTVASYTTNIAGYYRVVLTNASGCSCTSPKVPVTQVPRPKASFAVDPRKKLCSPGAWLLFSAAMTPGETYDWYFNLAYGTPVSSGAAMLQNISANTTVSLIVTNQFGCKDTCIQYITVDPLPTQPTISTTGICEGQPVTLTVTNHSGNISWNTGDTTVSVTVFTAGTYIATYTDPVTGCTNSNRYTLLKRPRAGLFPHNCDSIPCACTRPFTLYAPQALTGSLATPFSVQWFNAITNAPLATGPSYNNAGAGVQTGSYYVILTDLSTGCKDTSKPYSVVVPGCDTCDCNGSTWGKLTLVNAAAPPAGSTSSNLNLSCGKRYTIPCNQTYTLNASYNCKDSSCNGKVTYILQPPTGTPVSGSGALTFTPTTSGVYTVKLYGWCGKKPCDSCLVTFVVTCPCDCKGSTWGPITLGSPTKPSDPVPTPASSSSTNPDNANLIQLSCKKTYVLDCNKPYSLNAAYLCADSSCNSKVTYKLTGPGGMALAGTLPFNTTPTVSGTYTMTLYGWCGKTICDSCTITFVVSCPCVCKGSTWGKIVMTPGNDDSLHLDKIGDPPVVPVVLGCKKTYNLDCKSPYTFSAAYNCKDTACAGKVTYSLQPPGGMPMAGTMPFGFTPMVSGTYLLTVYGWCGDVICDSCVIKLVVNCDCCKGSKWRSRTITDGTVTKNLKCGAYAWACNQSFGIDAIYDCATEACGGSTSYQLIPATGTGPVQTGTLPLNYTPTVSGTYTVTLYGYCAGQLCDSCVATFKVDCPKDTTCCKYDIGVKPGVQTYSQSNGAPATVLSQGFTITGLAGIPLSEVRAQVMSFDISANYEECLACKSMPFVWASVRAAAAISGVPGLVTMYAGATVSVFNPTGTAVYQNPREVVWNNGNNFLITGPLQLDFFLPPAPKPDCCKLRGRVCVKFTFRGVDCKECEAVTCFDIAIP